MIKCCLCGEELIDGICVICESKYNPPKPNDEEDELNEFGINPNNHNNWDTD